MQIKTISAILCHASVNPLLFYSHFFKFAAMKKDVVNQFVVLLKCLLLSLVVLTGTRLLLYWFNPEHFDSGSGVFLNVLWYGMRFDMAALAAFQAPFIFIFFIPFSAKKSALKHGFLSFFFCLANLLFILLNGIDSIYYRFVLKRSTADLFSLVTTGQSDSDRDLQQCNQIYSN